jgi:hypothetical protein
LATRLQTQGASVIEFRQTVANFSEPTKQLDALMRSGKIGHDNDPVLAWMIGNVVDHYDANENVYPRKERPENKIDGAWPSSWPLAGTWCSRNKARHDKSSRFIRARAQEFCNYPRDKPMMMVQMMLMVASLYGPLHA